MGTLDQILDYGNALAEALFIIELKARHGNAATDNMRLQGLAKELLPAHLGKHYCSSSEVLWRYVSTTNLDGNNELDIAATRMALAYFPADEVLMAAANRGNRRLALIAGCIINYENQARPPPDSVTQIIEDANVALSARVSEVPYSLQ